MLYVFFSLSKQQSSGFPKLCLVCLYVTCLLLSSLHAYETVCESPGSPWKLTIEDQFVVQRDGYTVCYDVRIRTPIRAYEYLTSDEVTGDAKRITDYFRIDREIPSRFQRRHDNYTNSNYDRGRMAASAKHTDTQENMNETLLVSNIAPQIGDGLNCGVGWWKLEIKIRAWVEAGYRDHVMLGPLYLPQYEGTPQVRYNLIGTSNIAVPTHYFKVVFLENAHGQVIKERGYILPNRRFESSDTLKPFKTDVAAVELKAGQQLPVHVVEPLATGCETSEVQQ